MISVCAQTSINIDEMLALWVVWQKSRQVNVALTDDCIAQI